MACIRSSTGSSSVINHRACSLFADYMSRVIYFSLAFLLCSISLVAQESGLPIAGINIGPPDSLDFIGSADSLAFRRRELINLMRLEAPGLLSGGTPFSRRALQIDAITINNFYISHGYLEAEVEESFTTTADERIEIYLRISEGRQFMLSELIITGNRLMAQEEITQFLNIQIGEPYNRVNIRNQIEVLRQHYQNQGKLTTDIIAEENVVEDGVHLRLSIVEGATYSIGDIKVIGLENIPEWYVMRELLFEQGDIFSLDRLNLSQQRIFESGLFSSVEIIPLVVGPETADIEVRIRELGRGSFDFSAGFSQIEAAAGGEPNTALSSAFQWWHFRVFNTSLRTGISLEGNLIWEQWLWPPDFLAAWDFVSPWTLGIRIPSSARIYADYRTTQAGDIRRRGIDLSLTSRRTQRHQPQASFGWVLINAPDIYSDSIAVGAERGFRLEYLYQGADNMINPQRGIIFQVQYSFQRTFLPPRQPFYQQIELDYRRYHSLTRNSVFAYRLKVGFLGTFDENVILSDYHLFDLGGSTSLRGWATPGAFSTEGGMAKWLVNLELRFPLFWILSSELFIDAGGLNALLEESYDVDQPILEWVTGWDIGSGLLISTPLGPIRLNAAVPLKGDRPGKLAYQVAFLHTF